MTSFGGASWELCRERNGSRPHATGNPTIGSWHAVVAQAVLDLQGRVTLGLRERAARKRTALWSNLHPRRLSSSAFGAGCSSSRMADSLAAGERCMYLVVVTSSPWPAWIAFGGAPRLERWLQHEFRMSGRVGDRRGECAGLRRLQ